MISAERLLSLAVNKMKSRYSVDNSNRLVIKRKIKSWLTEGKFSVDKNNNLIYLINGPAPWRRSHEPFAKVAFKGRWRLDAENNLEFILKEGRGQYGKEALTLKGRIISTDRDMLAFEIKSVDRHGQDHISLLRLTGSWQSDEYNRIVFLVKRQGQPNALLLGGAWQVGHNRQIAYAYEKTNLKTKSKSSQVISFTGFWQINNRNRLAYVLENSLSSYFDFRAQLESPNIYPQDGVIKYRIGVGLKKEKLNQEKTISIYGTWKFSRKAGLIFQVDCGRNRGYPVEFGVSAYLNKKDEVVFILTNKKREPLGIKVVFTHRLLEKFDAQVFLRLKRLQREKSVEAGIRIPF